MSTSKRASGFKYPDAVLLLYAFCLAFVKFFGLARVPGAVFQKWTVLCATPLQLVLASPGLPGPVLLLGIFPRQKPKAIDADLSLPVRAVASLAMPLARVGSPQPPWRGLSRQERDLHRSTWVAGGAQVPGTDLWGALWCGHCLRRVSRGCAPPLREHRHLNRMELEGEDVAGEQ